MLRTDLPEIITETLPGPKARAMIERRAAATPKAIGCPYPVVIKRGEGAMIEDVDGNKFLDWIGGVGVLNIGYSQPEVVKAVKAQADNYFHGMFNTVTHEGYVALAEKLCEIAPVKGAHKKAFFANSGAEADENAVKVAKAYTGRPNIIVFSGAFHGRTLLTMSMTSKKAYAVGMGPFPDGIYRAQFPYYYRNPEGLPQEAAVDYYMKSIRDVFEQCAPAPGTIGGTFCGNALACAAALKVIEVMERDHLADRSLEIGRTVMARYTAMLEKYECVGDVRGLGGMVGIEFVTDKASKTPDAALTAAIIQECARNGLMVESAGTYSNVIRFLAPLVMTDEQLACGLDILERAIQTCSAK